MAWTYTFDPTSSAKDEVRFLIGDTDVSKPWTLQDGEIQYAIGLYSDTPPIIGDNFLAAAVCAESILAKLKGSMQSKSIGDLHIQYNPQTVTLYEQTAYRMRQRAALRAVPAYLGGYSISEKQGQDADPDRVQPAFKVDGMNKVSNQPDDTDKGL